MTYDEYRKTTCEWCGKGNEAFGDSPLHWINTTGQPTYGYVACAALSPEAWGALESARAELLTDALNAAIRQRNKGHVRDACASHNFARIATALSLPEDANFEQIVERADELHRTLEVYRLTAKVAAENVRGLEALNDRLLADAARKVRP